MTRILDNIEIQPGIADRKLGPHLQTTLSQFDRMDVAVGYFNLRGWSSFDQLVREKTSANGEAVVRILIGMVTGGPQRETLDALQSGVDATERPDADRATSTERKSQLLEQLRTQLMRGLPTATDRKTLQSLRDLIAEGKVQVKVFTRQPLHGKAYIFHREDQGLPILGYVGSSNLTWPGLYSNYELNVDVVDNVAAEDLAKWFQARWEDRLSREVTKEILDLLDESWATPVPRSPYEVYLKVCYDLSRDVREGLAEYSIPPEIASQLLKYQTTAVRTLARRIMTKGGTMLGDVVGLGKTLTAIAVALMLRDEHGYIPLVVCPKNLVEMWEDHLHAYQLHGAKVIPYSMVHKELPELRRHAFVIIDESHTLRNNERRDYVAVRDYIRDNDSKVLELTATPYNIQFTDVANQLGLFIGEDDDLGISPTNALANDPRLIDKVDGKITTLAAFRRSDDPDDWKRLMSENLVRRTRSFIKANFTQKDADGREYLEFSDGRRFTFPTRVATPVSHAFGENDPARIMASEDTLNILDSLLLPRYDLAKYLDKTTLLTDVEMEWVEDIARGRGQVAGFVKTTFYKRLSSGGYAFALSLRRHVARNELFVYAIDSNLPLPTGTILDMNLATDEDEAGENELDAAERLGDDPGKRYEALKAANPSGVTWVRPDLFTAGLRDALDRDTTALCDLLDSFGNWEAARDSKLDALIKLVTETHPDQKVLIFTEYKDTAIYVATQLAAAGVDGVADVTGQSENPTRLAHRFSPRSNALPGQEAIPEDDELRILVATDVLSEGQNLQDAHIIVNYDLPWAIIRLIQRAGRVDRVGQTSDTVHIYSFFHDSVEQVIRLRQRIGQRLSANAEAFGSDEQFFGGEGEVKIINDLYTGTLDDAETTDDVDASSLAYEIWRTAEEEDPTLAKKVAALPDLIDANRVRRPHDRHEGVACFVRTQSGVDGFGFAPPDAEPRLLTGHEALRVFQATKEEIGLPPREDHEELVTALVRGPLSKPQTTAGRLRGVRRQVWQRLGETLNNFSGDTEQALESLYQHPLTAEAERRLKRAIRSGMDDETLAVRITALHRDGQLVFESHAGNDPIRIVSSMGITA